MSATEESILTVVESRLRASPRLETGCSLTESSAAFFEYRQRESRYDVCDTVILR